MNNSHIHAYRPEIDGLRALAVIPVILFHAGLSNFSGGFVGVDVFFVISGYLITSIILREVIAQQFSLIGFYERRARRILPALFTVLFVSSIASWFILFPADMESFGKSVLATIFFSSNILFWQEGGYFGTANELKPLLHTWSLAVEEQFYIFYPLGFLLFWKLGRKSVLAFIIVVTLISFILADWASIRYLQANFFLLPTRAWELFIGAFVAFVLQKKMVKRTLISEIVSVAGILMIFFAIFMFDHNTPFPGRYALLPVIGTALFIAFTSQSTLMGRLFSLRPIVFVGLISYSAYLWHQPLFALTRLASWEQLNGLTMMMLIGLTFVLAWISWRFIENPFRNKSCFPSKRILSMSLCGIMLFFVVGGALVYFNGVNVRFDEKTLQLIATSEEGGRGRNGCTTSALMPSHGCIFNPTLGKTVLLWGDSHGMALAEKLALDLSKNDISLETLNSSGCTPVLYYERPNRPGCEVANIEAIEYLKSDHSPDIVVLSSRWAFFFEEEVFDNGQGGVDHSSSLKLRNLRDTQTTLSQSQWMSKAFIDTIAEILKLGKSIVIVGMVPEVGWDVPRRLALMHHWGVENKTTLSTQYDVFLERNKSLMSVVSQVELSPKVQVIFPHSLFCDLGSESQCIVEIGGNALYRDDNHLSYFGASLLSPSVASMVKKLMLSKYE